MWNDITLTSQPSDVPRGDCKEGLGGGERKKKCQVLLIAVRNKVSGAAMRKGETVGRRAAGKGL